MATTIELERVTAIVLRFMRPPLFVMIAVYAIGTIGMALMPGQDVDGNPQRMNVFHAFYFFTYTATTTGFGEIPNEFSDEQRLWSIFCLYIGVIAWLYAIGQFVRLAQNPYFLQALAGRRFARSVKQITEPFFIICGFGDTGSLLARGLSDNDLTAVVIDNDRERIKALGLRDYRSPMPGLYADASVPKHLVDAGVKQPNCKAVVALTPDEDINLKIAVMTRFLNPAVQVLCRSTSARHQTHLNSLESVHVINPFELFADQLSTTITAPRLHMLGEWLVRARGIKLESTIRIPIGSWILCGYGRMGKWLHEYFAKHQIPTVIIDPNIEKVANAEQVICGYADHGTLQEAGIERAAGIVAGTHNDSDNLGILLSVRALNPNAFSIVRQNHHENKLAFDGASANLIMQPSLVTARKVLLMLISPLVPMLLEHLKDHDPSYTDELINRLQEALGDMAPHLWSVCLCQDEATAATELWETGKNLRLDDLVQDPREPGQLPCVPLVIQRGEETILIPPSSQLVQLGDQILFCGTRKAEHLLNATLKNTQTLNYLITGNDAPRGYFFSWLARW